MEFPVEVKNIFWSKLRNVVLFYISDFYFINFLCTALMETGIRDLFNVIVGNEDYENAKPSPDAFLTAANQLGVLPQFCWAFEDS